METRIFENVSNYLIFVKATITEFLWDTELEFKVRIFKFEMAWPTWIANLQFLPQT